MNQVQEATVSGVLQPGQWDEALGEADGRQLILAGPGTGKTEFLARRAAYLLGSGVSPEQLLVLTFSRRAAAELDGRIGRLLERPTAGSHATTFHSFAHRLVEHHRFSLGQAAPILLTGPEQVGFVARLLSTEDPTAWPLTFRPLLESATLAAEVADFVMRCHERLIDPERLGELAAGRADWRALPAFLDRYRTELDAAGKIDYGLLISTAVEVLDQSGSEFEYVIVDEYQDTSPAQARLAELASTGNLTVAADPHQSIYSFRGADPDNVARLQTSIDREGGRIHVLGQSFRVPAQIMESARRLVAPNLRGGAHLPRPAHHEGTVEAFTFDQRSAEAEWIASEVERLWRSDGLPLSEIAVLVRSTRHLLPELSRALDRRQIPHDRPDTRLVDHPAIRLFVDMVVAAIAPPDSPDHELAVRRLLLGPAVGISMSELRELEHHRLAADWPTIIDSELPEASGLAALLRDGEWATDWPAVDGFWHAWDRMPGLERLVAHPERRDYRRAWHTYSRVLERQSERDPHISFADSLSATLSGDFEASPLLRLTTQPGDRLVVTTLHQAKGLEFEVVFIADAIDGVFPDNRRMTTLLQPQFLSGDHPSITDHRARLHLEEERRLAYTATTRARRRVVWTATLAGIDEGERRPSRFILPAAGLASFQDVGAPRGADDEFFAPLTLQAAEAQLRRILIDPAQPAAARLAALQVLVDAPYWDASTFPGVPDPGPDTGVIDGAIRLSPSQATLYDRCPRQYVLERRLAAVQADSPYLQFGSMVHEVLEETELRALEEGRPHGDLETALAELNEVWERYPPFGPPEFDSAWRRRAQQLLEKMYAEWPGDGGEPLALEIELNMELGGVDWVGRADRIDRTPVGLKVVDYKTSKSPPPIKEAALSLQLGYYLLAAAENQQLAAHGDPVAAELWYPLADSHRVLAFDLANLEEVRARLEAVAEGVLQEDWRPRVGAHCDRCPFREVCPAWPDGRESRR